MQLLVLHLNALVHNSWKCTWPWVPWKLTLLKPWATLWCVGAISAHMSDGCVVAQCLQPCNLVLPCRQVSVLDSVPDLDMLAYLPQLLDGLMNLLSDPNREIRVAAHKCMMEFLVEIQVGLVVMHARLWLGLRPYLFGLV